MGRCDGLSWASVRGEGGMNIEVMKERTRAMAWLAWGAKEIAQRLREGGTILVVHAVMSHMALGVMGSDGPPDRSSG